MDRHPHPAPFKPNHDPNNLRYRELSLWLGPTLANAAFDFGDFLLVLRTGLKLRFRKAIYEDASNFITIVPVRPEDDDPFSIAMQAETGHPCTRGVQIALTDILYVIQNPDGLY